MVSISSLKDANIGTVNVTLTFDRAMNPAINPSPSVTGLARGYTISGSAWAGGNTQWTGSFNFVDDNEHATGTYSISGFTDSFGNVMDPSTAYTVAVDTRNPGLSPVTIASDNGLPALAKTGNTVILNFTADENIQPPAVTIGGNTATVTGGLTI